MRAAWRLPLVLALAALAAACADFLLAPETPPRTPHALRLDRQSLTLDDGQHDRLVATVLDQGGAPLDTLPTGLKVRWSSSADSVAAVDTGGGVSAGWPGTAGVTATIDLAAGPLSIGAAVTVRAVPTRLAVFAGDSQTGAVGARLAHDLTVRVTERHGVGVPADTVAFAVSAGTGALSADTVVTDASGYATTAFTADTLAGPVTVQAKTSRLPAVTARFLATIAPAAPAAVRAASGDAQSGAPGDTLAHRLVARVTDRYGNVVPGVAVTWAVTAGGGSVAPAAPTTDSAGRVAAVWTLGSAGTQALRASVDTLSATFTATLGLGIATRLVFITQPTDAAPGAAIAPAVVVSVQDAAGNQVPSWGSPVTIALGTNPGGAALGGTLSQSASAGAATFGDLTVSAVGTGYTLVASSPGLASATSATFAVSTLAIMQIGIPGPDIIGLGLTNPLDVTLAAPAPAGGIQLTLSSDNTGIISPAQATVTVPAGQTTARVTLNGLALGTTTVRVDAPGYAQASLSAQVTDQVVSIAASSYEAGYYGTCVIRTGVATCWGQSHGSTPLQEPGSGWVLFSLGAGHQCALTATGTAYCWGDNTYGQLGDGSFTTTTTPVAVAGGLQFARIQAGFNVTCGITTRGAVYCWGQDAFGVMNGIPGNKNTPTEALGKHTFRAFTGGFQTFCALTTGDEPFCWGNASAGAAGDNGAAGSSGLLLTPTLVVGGHHFKELHTGGASMFTCAIEMDSSVWCFGQNPEGELGLSQSFAGTFTPHQVPGLTLATLSTSVNGFHSCGLTAGGAAICWGYNNNGQLGNGTQVNGFAPTSVAGGLTFVSIAAGDDHTCAATAGGTLYCWGDGRAIGDGITAPHLVPTAILQGAPTQIAFTTAPSTVQATQPITPAIVVTATDAFGGVPSGGSVTLSFGRNATGTAVLGGTLTQPLVSGVATFSDVTVSEAGTAFSITATAANGLAVTSGFFDVTAPPPPPVSVSSIDIVGAKVVGLGRATPLLIRLSKPAAAGGATVQVTSDAPGVVGIGTAAVAIAAGDSFAFDTLAGVSIGTTTVHAAIGSQSPLSLSVQSTDQVNTVLGDSLTTGAGGACAIRSGTTYCWGWNSAGQLGNGTTTNALAPVVVQGGLTFVAITAGGQYTCGLTADGTAWCWGANNFGQLGNGGTTASLSPVPVTGGLHFSQLRADGSSVTTCGVTLGGALYCWGSLPWLSTSSTTPVAVMGNQTWKSVSVLLRHVCAVTTTGTMLCPGLTGPVRIPGMPDTLSQASVGSSISCGLASGKPWCQGTGTFGELGIGTIPASASVATPVLGSEMYTSLSTADWTNCGLTTTGAAFCWGNNGNGNVGDGTITNRGQPVAVLGGLTFVVLKAGQGSTCGVTTANEVWCWGANNLGQLGDGSGAGSLVPVRTLPISTTPIALPDSLAMGRQHSCAIRAGVTYCWGWNVNGQLGNGTSGGSSGTPVVAAAGYTFVAVTAGQSHTCGLTANGTAWCWGDNSVGELGDSLQASGAGVPVRVAGGHRFTALAANGNTHTCGITPTGDMYCWGDLSGTIGGTQGAPVLMPGGQVWTSVRTGFMGDCGVTTSGTMMCYGAGGALSAAPGVPGATLGTVGLVHACGLSTGGKPYCWGDNTYGELGWGTVGVSAASADTVLGNERYTSIAAGFYITCGLTTTGQINCWGTNNGTGELGDGTYYTGYHVQPAPVSGGLTFVAVRIANGYGGQTACGITSIGEIWCWGRNDLGQIDATGTPFYTVPTKVF